MINSSLTITPKREGHDKIAYGTEMLHSATIEMYSLSENYKFKTPPVDRTTEIYYVEDRRQSLKKVTKIINLEQNLIAQREHRLHKKRHQESNNRKR